MTRTIALRDLLPKDGGDHSGTLAHLDAAELYSIGDVEDRAERLRIATFRVFLAAGLPMTRASEFVQAIDAAKRLGLVA